MGVTKDVTRIILRRGDDDDFTNEIADTGITQYEGEPKWNTDGKQLYVYDGTNNVRVPTENADSKVDLTKIEMQDSTLLETPVTGTIEFDDDRLYVTNVGTQRSIDRTSDVALSSVACANTTDETTMWTGTIGANDLKVGNILKVTAHGQISNNSSADVLTLKFYIGATEIATIDSPGKNLDADCWAVEFHSTVRSVGESGVLGRWLKMEIEDDANVTCGTTSVDTTGASNITITAQWNNAKEDNTFGLGLGWLEFKN